MKKAGKLFSLALGLAFLLNIFSRLSFAQASDKETTMNVAPSVVAEISSYEQLNVALDRADVIIFSVNEEGNVRLSDKQSYSIKELYERCGDVVPAVRVQTQAEADALSAFLIESGAEDFFVLSDSAQMIGDVRSKYSVVRGIYDASNQKLSGKDAGFTLAGEACSAQAQVVLLEDNVSRSVVEQIQARSMLVWVSTDTSVENIWMAATSGCFGIVNSDPSVTKQVLSDMDEDTLIRPVYIAGHRGYPKKFNENSVEGVEGAFKVGATHAEIDLRLTADGHIVIMHDATIDRITNGTGNVSQMKLEEIRKYKIVDNVMLAGQAEIPTLDDMLEILEQEEFSDKLMILEIKDNSLEMPDKIAEVIDKHPDVRNRLLFIAFSENILPDLAEKMTDIPRGFLDSLSTDDFLRRMSPVNAFIDNILAAQLVSVANAEMLRDYGYSVWAWTYNDVGALVSGMHAGFLGLTANNAGDLAPYIRSISAPQTLSAKEARNGYMVTATLFDGTQKQVKAKWVAISEKTGVFLVQHEDEDNFLTLSYYTQPVTVHGAGCKGEMSGMMLSVSLVICIAAVTLIVGRKI